MTWNGSCCILVRVYSSAGLGATMFTLQHLIWAISLPAAIAALVMTLAWQPWHSRTSAPNSFWAGAVALAASFAVAYPGVARRSPIPPIEAPDWLFVMALGCLVAGLLDGFLAIPPWIRRLVACLWFVLFDWLLLRLQ